MNTDTLTNYFKPILYRFHDREAIVYKTGFRSIRISYLDLYDHACRMANWYQHNGLKKGDAILIWTPNSPEWVAAVLACSLTGVIAVPLDMRAKPEFVQHIAGETGAKAGIKSKFMSIDSNLPWWDTQDLSRQIHEAPPIFEEPAKAQPIKNPLYQIISSVSKLSPDQMKPSSTLGLDLQMDSLSRVELVGVIEEELGVELDETHITDSTTIADLEKLITSQKKVVKSSVRQWPLAVWAVFARRLLQAGFARPLMRYYIKLRVMGKEKFDGLNKPFLLIANHISHLDALVLTLALPWDVRKRLAVAAAADTFEEWDSSKASLKEKLARKSATALALLALNIFPFQRYSGIKRSLEYTGSLMDKGWSVMIFPEGKLSHDGTVKDFKTGVGLLVKELDVPVVPAKIMGVFEIMDYRFQWPQKHGEVTVRFGNPISFSPDDTYEEITKKLEHEVRFL